MNTQRPVNLDLTTIKMPVMAISSILHRISGVVLFLGLPVLLYMLQETLASEARFETLKQCLTAPWAKFGLWAILTALCYHLIAGVRHLVMDLGHAESLSAGRQTSIAVIALSLLAAIGVGVVVW
ncbi:succinate dehydrogenase, cytochrome b556 subunit [Permianibacter aggregans]|uniref:Succinate dehydrogenase cytochrome b556 subunit n=1 Tax=Permianibacter aggregans TaxID=1510150 RepID=A0A4R6UFM7_9GAMM|nr:succinate dehydrogenase, cytochrome b556 subunit [Permianibacter aggregans]QGX38434.1 succinate dehydrogenase, cytochrome b556 subunit [Permianibacter aggregans]TDQ45548.1 succinate dehydrogenase subunit C [Permianibacter aggregans]